MDDEYDIYNDLEEFDWQQKYLEQSNALKKEQSKALTALNKISTLENDILKVKQDNETLKNNLAVTITTFEKEVTRKDGQILQLRKEKDNICFRRAPPTNNFKIPKKTPSFSMATQTDLVFNMSTTTQTDSDSCENSKTQNNRNYSKNKTGELEKDGGKYKNYNNNVRDRLDLTNKKRSSDFDYNNSRIRTNDRFYGTSKNEPKQIPEPNRNEKKYSNDRHYNRRNDERCDKRKWNEDEHNSRDYQKRGRYEKNYTKQSQKEDEEDIKKLQEKHDKIRRAIYSENGWEPEDGKTKENFEDITKTLRRMSPNNQIEENVLEFSCQLPPVPVISENLQPINDLPAESSGMSEKLLTIQTNDKVPEDNGSINKYVPEDNESCEPLLPVLSEVLLPQNKNISEEPVLSSKGNASDLLVESSLLESLEELHKKVQSEEKVSEENISTKSPDPVSFKDLPEEIICKEKVSKIKEKETKKSVRSRSRSNESLDKKRTQRKEENKETQNIKIHKQVPDQIIATESTNPEVVRSRSRSNESYDKKRTTKREEKKASENKEPQNIQINEEILSTEPTNPKEPHKKSVRSRSRSKEILDKNRTQRKEEKTLDSSKESTPSEPKDDLQKKAKRSRRMSVYCNKEEQQKISESDESTSKLQICKKKSRMSRRMSIFFGEESCTEEPSKDQEKDEISKNQEILEDHSDINLIINKKTGKVRKSSECISTSPSQVPEKIDSKKTEKKSSGRDQKELMDLKQVPEVKLPELQNETISEAVKYVEKVLPKMSEILPENEIEKDSQHNSQSSDTLETKDEEKSSKKSEKSRKTKQPPNKMEETKIYKTSDLLEKEDPKPVLQQLPETSEKTNSKIPEPVIVYDKSSNLLEVEMDLEKSKKDSVKPILGTEIIEVNENSGNPDVEVVETKIKLEEKPDKKSKNRKSSEKLPNKSSKDILQTAASRKSFDPPKIEEDKPPVLHSILRSSKTPTKNKKVRISEEFLTEPNKVEIEHNISPAKAFTSIADLLNTPIKPEIVKVEEVIFMKSRKKLSKSNKNISKEEEAPTNLIENNTEVICPPLKEIVVEPVLQTKETEKSSSEVICPTQKDIVVEPVLKTEETEIRKSNGSFTVLEVVGNETVILLNRKRKKKKDKN